MSIAQRLTSFTTRVATEFKTIRTLINGNQVDLSSLNTTSKGNLVLAINEVSNAVAAEVLIRQGLISDLDSNSNSSMTTASNAKIRSLIASSVSQLVNGSPAVLDTLKELADAIGDDPNFAASMSTALGNRLRLDANQTLTSAQQLTGRNNLDVYSKAEIGDPETDFVSTFNSGLA